MSGAFRAGLIIKGFLLARNNSVYITVTLLDQLQLFVSRWPREICYIVIYAFDRHNFRSRCISQIHIIIYNLIIHEKNLKDSFFPRKYISRSIELIPIFSSSKETKMICFTLSDTKIYSSLCICIFFWNFLSFIQEMRKCNAYLRLGRKWINEIRIRYLQNHHLAVRSGAREIALTLIHPV